MTNPAPGPGSIEWRITQQVEQLGNDGTGRFIPGVLVSFTSVPGGAGQVFVPASEFTVESVALKVGAKAKLMGTVSSLTGKV